MGKAATIVIRSILAGAVVAFAVGALMAGLDWRLNPGGIFRSEAGTEWSVVAETVLSWFWPTWPGAAAIMAAMGFSVAWWRGRR